MQFKRNIGWFGIMCMSIGGIIGSGWLFGPLFAAQMAGPASLIAWIIGGASCMFIALTFAELSAMYPISAGIAVYPIFTHGKVVGFVLTWITWITYVVSVSQEVQSTVLYMGNRYPFLIQKVDGVNVFSTYGYMISFLILIVLSLINSFGAKFLSRTNSIVSVWKLIVPILVVVTFLFTQHHFENVGLTTISETTGQSFAPYGFNGVLSAVALAGVLYAFTGFQHAAILAGESKKPQRDVPLAIIGSLFICTIVYTALQYTFITSLPTETLTAGWKNISFAGDAGPLAGMAVILGLSWLAQVLYIDSIISPLGTGIIYAASSARVVQTMASSGNAPHFLAKLSKSHIPFRAILFNFGFAMLAFLPFGGWQSFVSFLSSALIFSFAVGPICLVALRKQMPNVKRPFLLPMYQFFSFIAFYVCNLMIYWAGWNVVWKLSLTIFAGFCAFIILDHFKNSNENKTNKATSLDYKCALWLIPYILLFSVISYFSSFNGGKNMIPLGIDFLIMAVFSLLIFIIAQKSALPNNQCAKNIEEFKTRKF